MKRRRKKKNPALTYVLVGGVVLLVVGVGAAVLLEKKALAAPAQPQQPGATVQPPGFGTAPNVPIPAAQAAAGATVGLSSATCNAMRNGQLPTSQDDLDACDKLGL